jgi:hypothetical protein
MGIVEKLDSFEEGARYGVEKALEFATQDHSLEPKIPKNVYSINSFYIGSGCGKVIGGLVCVPLVFAMSLGTIPTYNIYKNIKLKKISKDE